MPEYRFTSTQELVYVDRALVVAPGDVVEWDQPPADGNWAPVEPSKTSKKATSSADGNWAPVEPSKTSKKATSSADAAETKE